MNNLIQITTPKGNHSGDSFWEKSGTTLLQVIELENPDSVAVRQYHVFKLAAGKTAKSILVSTAVRLAPFNLPQIQAITGHGDMDLYTLGEKKCALYAVIPDNDSTLNFLVSLLYVQAFQALYYSADQIRHGALLCHVHFVLDEFAAMSLSAFQRYADHCGRHRDHRYP